MQFSLRKNKAQSLMAVDVTASAVRMLQLHNYEDQFAIKHIAKIALHGENHELSQLVSTLKAAYAMSQSTYRGVATYVHLPHISLSKMTMDAELTQWQMYQLIQQHFVHDPQAFDFSTTNSDQESSESVQANVVSTPMKAFEQTIFPLKKAGFKVKIIDIENMALYRAALQLDDARIRYLDKHAAYVNCDGQQCTVIVLSNNKLTNSEYVLKKNLIAYLLAADYYNQLDEIVVCGDSSQVYIIQERLKKQTDINVRVADPLANMTLLPGVNQEMVTSVSPEFMICGALALRGIKHDRH